MERGYQADFYTLCNKVGDATIRERKADKVRWALETYADRELGTATCLDVGCSSGVIAAALSPLFAQTFGVDYDGVALGATEADSRVRVGFLRGDAMRLPFPDGSIDVVICAQVYEHVPDDERLFQEIHRVLAADGVVFFSGPNWLYPIEPHYFLPFLHWLPGKWADGYLRLSGLGDVYYERSRHLWGLRRLAYRFEVVDISVDVLFQHVLARHVALRQVLSLLPDVVWWGVRPLLPNFNWVLRKPAL
jgi:SAM-dependent methyltransferase